ncbi:right-handed parallel beta-helix repeat-containing protein [bacterium]|nr:right-handed parallel beta-helix repeat-containing protein [bacterium]
MGNIKIYSELRSGKITFEGSKVNDKDIGSIEAIAHPTLSNRVIIKSLRQFKRGSDTEYRVFFRKLNINRICNKEGQDLTSAPLNMDRDAVIAYLDEQFRKPVVQEYFEYNPTTDRLEAKKDIQVNKSGFFLGEKHKMASGNSNIYFEDLDNRANSYPVFGEVLDQSLAANQLAGAGVTLPKTRIFTDFQSVPLGGSPVNDTAIGYDGDNFFPFNISGVGITTRVAEVVAPTQQLKYEIIINGISVYVQYLEHNGLAVNEDLTWYFNHPLDVENGTTLRATVYKVSTVDNQEQNDGILQVCEGDDVATRYQTNVLSRFFTDEPIALKSDVAALLNGSTYKGSYNGSTAFPTLPTGTDVLGDFYRVTAPGGGYATGDILVYNGGSAGDLTDYDHIAEESATQSDIKNSGLKIYDIYVKAGYAGAVQDGSVLYPYSDLDTAIGSTNDGDSIYIEGSFEIAGEITLPQDKSLYFYGSDDACISFTTYSDSNGSLLYFDGLDNTKELKFRNIKFHNAGGYGLYLKKTAKVTIEDCEFKNNGWNGTSLNTILPSTTTALLGYDSSATDLQAFYAGVNASNGGAMRIQEATQVLITGNTITNNLRGLRVQDCGINGGGVVSRNQSTQNIESGIYIAAGALGGCQNITTTMNLSAYNVNNGLLVIGGINNKFSQNEVNGNWNAGFCAWGSANTTLRDCGLYDNNRSQYNGIGNTGDAKASIQINEAYNLLGTQITLNPAFRFIAEILDTQVHYTGLGSNTEKIGFLITSAVGALADNAKNIIKVDDVGFIGQDYAIDLSEVDVSNLRLSLGDNSFQSITYKAVKAPLAGNYNELPFSNHVMEVPEVDVVVDTLKHMITLAEGVGGNTINTYQANELRSIIHNGRIDIIQANTDKIQLRDLSYGSIYVNGVIAGNTLSSANDSLNAAFGMDLVEYKDVLVNEVGINGDESSGGSLPAIANNWYISYGAQAGTQNTSSTIGNNFKNFQPHYNGEALEKGHEFIWTANLSVDFVIGIWGGAEVASSAATALLQSSWAQGFRYDVATTSWNESLSNGVDVTASGNIADKYVMTNGQMALRFGNDGYLYLFEVVAGGYTLVGKSNSTIAGTSVMIQFGGYMTASFPNMVERTETWEIVHDLDNSENGEWSDGLEDMTVLRSRMSFSPGQKVTMDLNHFGRNESIGFGYLGASSGVTNADQDIVDRLFYNSAELLRAEDDSANGSVWTWNTASSQYYDPNGDGSNVGYLNSNGTLGLISLRYKSDNSVELWHETNNELIATKTVDLDGTSKNIYFGSSEDNHTADRIPTLTKYSLTAEDEPAAISSWWYIDSPDGSFYYPLFQTAAEANAVDIIEGGSGTNHTHTFADDLSGKTWYMPDTSGVHAGSAAPQGGVFGNSINVVWNEQVTGADSGFIPTFNNITYLVQEGSAINIPYKPAGDTNTYNVTNVPAGYADNGSAIIGTAEDISNGYGQSVIHTINVTKANAFGSVTGTITINVLADLAGNEFQIIDKEDGTIKFTQDGGITELDFNTVTFNAGSTYKFYLDHYSIESSDGLSVVDSSGNVLTGGEGLSSSGNSGDAGAYMQYVIPADVAPGKFLRYYDNDTSANYTDIPMILAGSTYTVTVTGITNEGPEDLSLTTETLNDNWSSIDETLSAGQRIILPGTFLEDVHNELPDGSSMLFGIKAGSWANTLDGNTSSAFANTGFEGGMCLKFKRNTSGGGTFTVMRDGAVVGATVVYVASIITAYTGIIEITADGNNIRFGVAHSSQNASTDVYSDWNVAKGETGDAGYGLTSIDVMAFYDKASATVAFDYDEIDWTLLSEIAVPVLSSNDTSWTKAIDFSGGGEYLQHMAASTFYQPLQMAGLAANIGLGTSSQGETSDSASSRPWATSIVFKADRHNSAQVIWNQGEGTSSGSDNISLVLVGNGDLSFEWARQGTGFNKCRIATNISSSTWYGVYIAHSGERLGGGAASASALADCFDIRIMSSADSFNAVGSNLSTSSNWINTGYRMDRTVAGDFTIGGRGSGFSYYGKVASMVVHSLRQGVAMPDDTEIKLMTTDSVKWEADYLVGNPFRRPFYSGDTANYSKGYGSQAFSSTQMWIMGDGVSDTFPTIRNNQRPVLTNYTTMDMQNMVSNDIENVSIPGLS